MTPQESAVEKPDRVQTKGGEAQDLDRAADARPEDADREAHADHQARRENELLDEGLEETFPASDPVSAKHIT